MSAFMGVADGARRTVRAAVIAAAAAVAGCFTAALTFASEPDHASSAAVAEVEAL